MENVDKTIEAICNWIQRELNTETVTIGSVLPEMVTALAELVSARGQVRFVSY